MMEFGRPIWGFLWAVVLVNGCWYSCNGCWEEERSALLQLKASINHPNGTSLTTWVEGNDTSASDCCQWESVMCSNTSGRVIELYLHATRWDYQLGDWYLNASLFLPFEELRSLDLRSNTIVDWSENQGSERLSSRLTNLEVLHLDDNKLNNSILSSLIGFSSLKSLNLGNNKFQGSTHTKELDTLTNLEELDLSENEIDNFVTSEGIKSLSKLNVLYLDSVKSNYTGILLQSLGAFSSLKTLYFRAHSMTGTINAQNLQNLGNLEDFFLEHSSLNESFLESVRVMTSLKVLSLPYCQLNGALNAQGLCELKNLQELDLSGNAFQGILPSSLGNLTSLRLLDLSSNQFTGNIASSPLTRLTLLEYLSISNNDFQVPISFRSFVNHSSLKVILGEKNKLLGEPMYHTWVPRFQLKVLILSNCRCDELNLAPPNFLYYQYDLRVVDLSHNNFGGKFSAWSLLQNNTSLEELYVRNCSIIQPFELPSHPNSNLSRLDVSHNKVQGQIPTNISLIFPNLRFLNMSTNAFGGNIPSSFGDLKSLESLDLSNNQLSGGIPEHLAMGSSSLSFFKLSNNSLCGKIFPSFFNLTSLEYLHLDGNNFEGEIPDISSAISLAALNMRNNSLSGKLPRWMGNMSELFEISLSENHLDGSIPVEFCNLDQLVFLDLSENNLSGSIPPCSSPLSIRHVHLNKNRLTGLVERALFYSNDLVTLDLGDNNLTGIIPNWIGNLLALSVLILKANHLEGRIPDQLCNLTQLSIVDLSRNNLSGTIPRCLSNISFDANNEKSVVVNIEARTSSPDPMISYVEGTKIPAIIPQVQEDYSVIYPFLDVPVRVQVDFTTKSNSYSYQGGILNFMSGIDLSCNQLTGEIPLESGNLSNIRALNLSHNNLNGSIPSSFSNLRLVESLDLSYNNLNGRIPTQLIELNYLAFFKVGHNNLSGRTPERKAQFATFEESSYEANPLLCGPPLHNNCTKPGSPSPPQKPSNHAGEDSGLIDKDIFWISFVVSYVIVLLGIAAVLYINPYWRQAWFHLVEVYATSCYYFVMDNFHKLSISEIRSSISR